MWSMTNDDDVVWEVPEIILQTMMQTVLHTYYSSIACNDVGSLPKLASMMQQQHNHVGAKRPLQPRKGYKCRL